MTPQVYISDTNIWIDLRNAGLLDAMFDLPFTLCCTDFVLNELQDFDHTHLRARGLVVETLDEQATAALFALMQAHNNSSLADVSCYQLAKQTGRPLLTGDGRLRKQALADGFANTRRAVVAGSDGGAPNHSTKKRSPSFAKHAGLWCKTP